VDLIRTVWSKSNGEIKTVWKLCGIFTVGNCGFECLEDKIYLSK
jgi:hypothetical protein